MPGPALFYSGGQPLIPHYYNLHYLNDATKKDRDRGAGEDNSFCSHFILMSHLVLLVMEAWVVAAEQ